MIHNGSKSTRDSYWIKFIAIKLNSKTEILEFGPLFEIK
jgi:hypothetical protein